MLTDPDTTSLATNASNEWPLGVLWVLRPVTSGNRERALVQTKLGVMVLISSPKTIFIPGE
jgi:hypothetical protein